MADSRARIHMFSASGSRTYKGLPLSQPGESAVFLWPFRSRLDLIQCRRMSRRAGCVRDKRSYKISAFLGCQCDHDDIVAHRYGDSSGPGVRPLLLVPSQSSVSPAASGGSSLRSALAVPSLRLTNKYLRANWEITSGQTCHVSCFLTTSGHLDFLLVDLKGVACFLEVAVRKTIA